MSTLGRGIRPRRLGHLGLVARDLERLVEFYCAALDLQVSDRMPYDGDSPLTEAVFLRCNTDHHVISMFGLREPPEPPPENPRADRPGLHHMAFEMASFDELRAAARYVREQGLPVRAMRKGGPGDQIRMYFWDPEDNMVELYWGLDQIGWDGRTRPYPPFDPVDVETFDVDAWLEEKGDEFRRADLGGTAGAPPRPPDPATG
jgi:catechol 2,3-dioxygenase-like lactoylglutathione lyase family enzyme